MKSIFFSTRQIVLICAVFYSQSSLASLAEQCRVGIPTWDRPLVSGLPEQLPVLIHSDNAKTQYPDSVLFDGNVVVQQGNSLLRAKQVTLNQEQKLNQAIPVRTATASGDVKYSDPEVSLQAITAWSNLNNKDMDMFLGKYQLTGRQGRGDADKMKLRSAHRYTIMENGTFTSCLSGDNTWSLRGSEVIYDREEQIAEIWNARFRVGKVPVLYSPYWRFPLGDRRRSGLLLPRYHYSGANGFEFVQPWYWNIAPNYDATVTPHWITKRGLQLENEFRYLTFLGVGTLAFDWLNDDREYAKTYPEDSRRWLMHWNHTGVLEKMWRFNVDYTRVSDASYFTELTSSYGKTTDGYATQKFSLGYAEQNWNATLASTQFQILTGNQYSPSIYRAQPEFAVNYYANDLGPFDGHIYGQVVNFSNINQNYPDASRWHIQPGINLPLANDWASLNTSVQLLATHYEQHIPVTIDNDVRLDNAVNRVMPKFKTDGKLVFERKTNGTENYTQTLEPRVQYLYIPHRNQDNIYIYDSTLLQADYFGLFRDSSYSGLDRISSANQITTGLTSRFYDESFVERFNLSVGQIYYFKPAHTGHKNVLDMSNSRGSLVWAGDSYWKMNEYWGLRGGVQYDTRLNSLILGNGMIEYRRDTDSMLQLNYRYANPEYVHALNKNYAAMAQSPDYQTGISQAGITGSWPIAGSWAVVGAYYYDTKIRQPASQLTGLQYNTCCWAARIGVERKIIGWNTNHQRSQYDNKILFNIELRGLSSNHSLGISEMLNSGILPYQDPF